MAIHKVRQLRIEGVRKALWLTFLISLPYRYYKPIKSYKEL